MNFFEFVNAVRALLPEDIRPFYGPGSGALKEYWDDAYTPRQAADDIVDMRTAC